MERLARSISGRSRSCSRRLSSDNSSRSFSLTHSIKVDYGSIEGVDDGKLWDLIQCVHHGDRDDTDSKLRELLGSSSGRYTKPLLIRAKVYSTLIAVALGLRPQDISKTKVQREGLGDVDVSKTEVQRDWVDHRLFEIGIKKWVDDGLVVLRYLLKEVLEEDDDLMTVIFCDLNSFKTYPVPYFVGCEINIVKQISYLWLSKNVLKKFYFDQLIDPIIETVKHATSKTDKNFIQAKLMLCTHLHQRRVKAGARLFWLMTKKRLGSSMAGELVKEIFSTKAHGDMDSFQASFLYLWDYYWYNLDILDYNITDRVPDGHGRSICVGQVSSAAHTDGVLLCWAARRGYHDLIWCVMQTYKPGSKSDIDYDDGKELEITEAWKYALWCATRHGNWQVILELSAPDWIKGIDFNDYPSGWLPPLHLAALLGDMEIMDSLCRNLDVKSGADKKDYLGKTPLDYAMQFKITATDKIKYYLFTKSSKKVEKLGSSKRNQKLETRGHKDVVKKLLHMPGVGERLKELYEMYIHQANSVLIGAALIAGVTFAGWLQPPLGYVDYFENFPSPTAPNASTYHSYVVFNSLSFFLAIATMFVGAEATLFVHDNDERTSALIRMRKSIKWMIGFFISSMLCIMAAFICAGMAILPPVKWLKVSMGISLGVGGVICLLPLSWVLWSLNHNRILSLIETRFIKTVRSTESDSPTYTDRPSLVHQEQLKKIRLELEKLEQPPPSDHGASTSNSANSDILAPAPSLQPDDQIQDQPPPQPEFNQNFNPRFNPRYQPENIRPEVQPEIQPEVQAKVLQAEVHPEIKPEVQPKD